jgi:hypothetical protein
MWLVYVNPRRIFLGLCLDLSAFMWIMSLDVAKRSSVDVTLVLFNVGFTALVFACLWVPQYILNLVGGRRQRGI